MLQAQAGPITPAPPNRDSPVTPQLAHFVTSPYEIALGAYPLHRRGSGLRFCTLTEEHRLDFHQFGNVHFDSRACYVG